MSYLKIILSSKRVNLPFFRRIPGLVAILLSFLAGAVSQPITAIPALRAFPLSTGQPGPSITEPAVPGRPFSVVGPRGAILGQQNGSYEVWLFPWKVLSRMHIEVRMENYSVPIHVNEYASTIRVRPGATTITFSHANFTIREVLLSPDKLPQGSGVLVFYQIQAVRPMTLTFSFDPVMRRMWPAPSGDLPSRRWVPTKGGSGFYILGLDFPGHAAAIAMPAAEPGILQPYQERPKYYPLQFVLHFDPHRDAHTYFPLLITIGNTAETTTETALDARLRSLEEDAPSAYSADQSSRREFLNSMLSIDTPDKRLDEAMSWAEVSMDELRVLTTPNHDEEALTAGFVGSGDSTRPGFGWYFGRDALWSLYAVNSYGGFQTARQEIEFLLRRQSPEGKIMHEWSQTADLVDWKALPYEYASADATPLLLMAVDDYLRISGDRAFVARQWAGLTKAWDFERTHISRNGGIYNNSQGTGWVESWVPKMPSQEIYLAALDEQASLAYADMAQTLGHGDAAEAAKSRATQIGVQIEREYYLPQSGRYAFSWNGPGKIDATPTIFPSVAWWDGTYALEHKKSMLALWASPEISTDWGVRDLSDQVSFYDPISYHQGSVWPLFTGWVSVAEYRTGQALAGWLHLEQNADLGWAQDPGNFTELLSGRFFQPMGRSTAHQLWSAAMVISPIVRGLFGIAWGTRDNKLSVTPSLPAAWDDATLHNLPFGNSRISLFMKRAGDELVIHIGGAAVPALRLSSQTPGAKLSHGDLLIPLPAIEVGVAYTPPEPGAQTRQMKVLYQHFAPRSLELDLEAPAGSRQTILLRVNERKLQGGHSSLRIAGAQLQGELKALQPITVAFPSDHGAGAWVNKKVVFSW